jgi:elongation factor 1-alpha
MITGTSQADAAILVISAGTGEFEAGISTTGQTREHALLAKTLGVNQLIVAVNKMDLADYKEERYNEISEEMGRNLKLFGFDISKINFVPVSGMLGDNLSEKSDKMPWYKGLTLLGVESGVLKPKENVIFQPTGKKAAVMSIEMHHEEIPEAIPGDNIGFSCKGLSKQDAHRGDVVGHEKKPPTIAKEIVATVNVIRHPSVIAVGYTPVVHCGTAQVAIRFAELKEKKPRDGDVVKNPDFLKNGDTAKVVLIPTRDMVIEQYSEFPALGRFAVRDMGQTVAVGIVTKVTPK